MPKKNNLVKGTEGLASLANGLRLTVAAALGSVLLLGCSTTRFYPICLINTGNEPVQITWIRARYDIDALLQQTITSNGRGWLVRSTGARIKASKFEHEQLATVWVDSSCYIDATGIGPRLQLAECQRLINEFLTVNAPYWPMPEATITCNDADVRPPEGL